VVTRLAGAAQSWRRARPVVAARRSKSLLALQFTKLDKVFTYGIVATRRSQFAHLGMEADGGGGWRLSASSASMVVGSGAPPAKLRAPTWALVFGDPSGMVDLARAVAHRRSGELNTAARVSIFAGQNSP
jgi:hypothetical protein